MTTYDGPRLSKMKWKKPKKEGSVGEDGEAAKPKKKMAKRQERKVTTTPQQDLISSQVVALQRLTQAGPKRIGPYSRNHKILLVGEGDFSFSLALASNLGGENLVCTSLDKLTQLQVKYEGKVNGALGTLQSLRAEIHHNVDATVSTCSHLTTRIDKRLQTLSDYEFTHLPDGSLRKFDRIVFNFPCVGLLEEQQKQAMEENMQKKLQRRGIRKKEEPEKKKPDGKHDIKKSQEMAKEKRDIKDRKLHSDKQLIEGFLKSACELLEDESSEIHMRIRDATLSVVDVDDLVGEAAVHCVDQHDFHPAQFSGYKPQQTHPNGKGLQPLTPATTLMYLPFFLLNSLTCRQKIPKKILRRRGSP
ncbi:hypothetical protein GUITHDRAFT_139738 [Guillardia theta CCMP2712]|uniref:25S rRNA (uridine-N(3))-methyltransferase BMT5-like domain-containing protein n=1 Tax=Guillardia theta (strain CCMP2712) TaxID=905079 RepID=L1J841_GUITC|nr:hypothetical protein GUITHDRAFT_139738 [Guillardia theta CCMP2712]EKX44502.1 hypothetical protein GUITHDRAFT_139738 [Guillardia theta CCMP2712]|eukprot:XP_005831482.1 hypothetical protein GUITHDRAFT_139738 [Guillardia theta CCMP2712]